MHESKRRTRRFGKYMQKSRIKFLFHYFWLSIETIEMAGMTIIATRQQVPWKKPDNAHHYPDGLRKTGLPPNFVPNPDIAPPGPGSSAAAAAGSSRQI